MALVTLVFLITGHTLIGHYLTWQRNDVYSLFAAKSFHNSDKKQTIDNLLNGKQQQIYTDAPEKIMLSFYTMRSIKSTQEPDLLKEKLSVK